MAGATETFTVRVEWGDCDPARIVFYPNYYRWLDAATHNLLAMRFGELRAFYRQHNCHGFGLIDATCRFHAPSRHGDTIQIESVVVACHRKVIQLTHRMTREGHLLVNGKETRFWTIADEHDVDGIRAGVIPDTVRTTLGFDPLSSNIS
jgi:4-hydroxybenzoyl-CoA thioesterase